MANITRMSGMSNVLNNLRKSKVVIGQHTENGLKKAGLFLQRKSQEVVPVDSSNLKGGAGTRNIGGAGFLADIIVFYLAIYAVFVHEDLDARHNPGQKAKFLEGPARENSKELLEIVKAG